MPTQKPANVEMTTSGGICVVSPDNLSSIYERGHMKKSISSSEDLGLLIRAVRKSTNVRQDDLSAVAGVSRQFAVDVERGKPTAQVGRVLLLLKELGVTLNAEISEEAAAAFEKLQNKRNSSITAPRAQLVPKAKK